MRVRGRSWRRAGVDWQWGGPRSRPGRFGSDRLGYARQPRNLRESRAESSATSRPRCTALEAAARHDLTLDFDSIPLRNRSHLSVCLHEVCVFALALSWSLLTPERLSQCPLPPLSLDFAMAKKPRDCCPAMRRRNGLRRREPAAQNAQTGQLKYKSNSIYTASRTIFSSRSVSFRDVRNRASIAAPSPPLIASSSSPIAAFACVTKSSGKMGEYSIISLPAVAI